ncbi:MAG TPA: CAP domain-containing protein [Actinomycetota bacterium]|nr:CAP domain-containing protein [Actinomycetota bacterium]
MPTFAHPGIKRIPVLLLLATFLLSGVLHGSADAATNAQRVERNLMNFERRPMERRTFKLEKRLSKIARRHSRDMAASGTLHHNSDLVQDVGNRPWKRLGENVGVAGSSGSVQETLQMLHGAFMDSDSHRRNILYGKYRKIGVGIVRGDGRMWVTIVFLG